VQAVRQIALFMPQQEREKKKANIFSSIFSVAEQLSSTKKHVNDGMSSFKLREVQSIFWQFLSNSCPDRFVHAGATSGLPHSFGKV
jgi:hypothetical protein